MNIRELEKAYLSCLLNGGTPGDIELKYLEKEHREIKRLKNKGLLVIPKKLVFNDFDYDEDRKHTAFFMAEIAEQHKKLELSNARGLLAESLKSNIPADMVIYDLKEELEKISKKSGRNEIISAHDLQKKHYDNVEFIVDRMIPVGMNLLIGAPKLGKSWLLLLMAECVTLGYPVFTHKTKRVPVLYYTLEDSVRRCKFRLHKISDPHGSWSDRLFFTETHNGTSGLVSDIKTTGARLVIIDTFAMFSKVSDGNDYYETSKIIKEIKQIADIMQAAILVVHHTRKTQTESGDWTTDIMGSQGLVGTADTVIKLDRKRDSAEGVLKITGRDIMDSTLKIKFNDCCWESDFDRK